jgi:hypothetical protein
MKNKSSLIVAPILLGALLLSSCGISSQDAYNKAPLSGFVANQTTELIKKNTVSAPDNANLDKLVAEHTEKISAIDADNSKAKAMVAKLEKQLDEMDALEKESKMELERSNNSVVFFEVGSAKLSALGMQELYRWKSSLDQGATRYSFSVSVFASADKSGSKQGNAKLRADRANAVKNFIVTVLGYKGAINIVTEQPAFSKVNDIDRRVMVSINCN